MTAGDQPPPPAGRGIIPVGQTAIESYRFVFGNLDRFVALGWAPVLVNVATQAAILTVMVAGTEAMEFSLARFAESTLLSLPSYAMYVLFAVRWHRLYLLKERSSLFAEAFAARNWLFLGYVLLLDLAPDVPQLFLGPAGGPVVVVLYLVFLRFSLVLPSLAVDRPLGLGEAWRQIRGYFFPYVAVLLLIMIPVIVVAMFIAMLLPSLFQVMPVGEPQVALDRVVVLSAVTAINAFFATAAGITVLSKFYRQIVGGETGEGGPVAGP